MEHNILMRLIWHLERHNIYSKHMAGFRRYRNFIDNVIQLASSVENDRRCCHIIGALFLNGKVAFDGVTHQAILSALSEPGRVWCLYGWMRENLQSRTIFVSTSDGN